MLCGLGFGFIDTFRINFHSGHNPDVPDHWRVLGCGGMVGDRALASRKTSRIADRRARMAIVCLAEMLPKAHPPGGIMIEIGALLDSFH